VKVWVAVVDGDCVKQQVSGLGEKMVLWSKVGDGRLNAVVAVESHVGSVCQ